MTRCVIAFLQSTQIKFFSIITTAIYVTAVLIATYNAPIYKEPIPKLEQPDTLMQELATTIDMGLHINSFPHFSFKETTFAIDGIVWFKFDQGSESLDTIEDFSIQNTIGKTGGKLFYKSKPLVKLVDDKVIVSYNIQATFMTEIIFKKFPIGDHRVKLFINNKGCTAHELLFSIKPENVTFGENLLIDNWRPQTVRTTSGIFGAQLGKPPHSTCITYPGIGITIDFENIGTRSLVSLYFPLFILFFIGLLSLSIGIFDTARLSIIASSLPTLVLFRLVIDAVSPEVGYATHIDFIYYVLVALSFIILFFQTYLTLMIEHVKKYSEEKKTIFAGKLELINGIIFMGVTAALIIIMAYDFYH